MESRTAGSSWPVRTLTCAPSPSEEGRGADLLEEGACPPPHPVGLPVNPGNITGGRGPVPGLGCAQAGGDSQGV